MFNSKKNKKENVNKSSLRNTGQKKKNSKKKLKINYKKTALFSLKVLLALGIIFIVFGASTAFGMFVASIQDVPEFEATELESTLPSKIKDQDGKLIARLDRDQYRESVSINEVPDHVVEAFIAIEDSSFYNHIGFDIRGITRAAYTNIRETGSPFGGLHGGSTITQQLVKNSFLTPEQNLKRKIQEVWLSLQVERSFTKEEIMELYLNDAVYFNHNAYGVQAASQIYFDKNVNELKVEEAALLAGIIRHPSNLSPHDNPENARQRQKVVLSTMLNQGFINEKEYRSALEKELDELLVELPARHYPHPHYLDYVINNEVVPILKEKYSDADEQAFDTKSEAEQLLYQGGLTIYTNMDRQIQEKVEEVMENDDNYPFTTMSNNIPQPQSSAVVTEPSTGEIKALFGGRAYSPQNMTNRVTSESLEPGSALKPIMVYGPAFEERKLSPGDVVDDSPAIWEEGDSGNPYTPENFSRTFRGIVTVREALVRSLNVPAVKTFDNIGKDLGIEYARKMGLSTLTSTDKNNLAAGVGGLDKGVNPIEMNQAYGTLANEGIKVEPYAVTKVEDRYGDVIYENNPDREVVISAEAAWLVTDILEDVTSHGTASSLNATRPVAAKTGTSQGSTDGWLVSYTPDRVTSIWVGFDFDGQYIQSATSYPINMTNQLLEPIHEGIEPSSFNKPDSIRGPIKLSNKSGLRPSELTPEDHITEDYFLRDMVPTEKDDAFVEKEICTESGQLAGDFCPPGQVETEVFLDRGDYKVTDERWTHASPGRKPWDHEHEPPEKECEKHLDGPNRPVGVMLNLQDDSVPEISWFPPFGEKIGGYNVYRKAPGEEFEKLTENPISDTSYIDKEVEEGENFAYLVRTVDQNGIESINSQIVLIDEDEEDDFDLGEEELEEEEIDEEEKEEKLEEENGMENGTDEEDKEDEKDETNDKDENGDEDEDDEDSNQNNE